MKERILNRESLTGALTAAFAALMLRGLDPRFGVFPRAIFIIMLALGLLMLLSALFYPGARRTPLEGVNLYEVCFIAIMTVCPFAISWLGFYAGAFLVILAIALLPLPEYSPRRLVRTVVYVFVITVITYIVFSAILNIKVPTGIFI